MKTYIYVSNFYVMGSLDGFAQSTKRFGRTSLKGGGKGLSIFREEVIYRGE